MGSNTICVVPVLVLLKFVTNNKILIYRIYIIFCSRPSFFIQRCGGGWGVAFCLWRCCGG